MGKQMSICPKCENPYYRHKGKNIKRVIKFRSKIYGGSIIKSEWTEKGYYCKRCKHEGLV